MRYLCLIYDDEKKWEGLSQKEQEAGMAEYGAFTESVKKNGHWIAAERLQPVQTATTVRIRNGKLSTTDGPYAETKEQIGGILILEARDLNHAIQLMSKHPGVKAGPFEIRPAAELSGMVDESEQRRAGDETK